MEYSLNKLKKSLKNKKDPEYISHLEKDNRINNREKIVKLIQELSISLAEVQDYDEAFKLIPLKRKYDSDSECISDLI